jgi:hypothetical protein
MNVFTESLSNRNHSKATCLQRLPRPEGADICLIRGAATWRELLCGLEQRVDGGSNVRVLGKRFPVDIHICTFATVSLLSLRILS